MLPSEDQLTICFAHVAYRLRERFLALATGIESFEVRDGAALERRIGEADVLVISGLWRNDLLPRAKRLRFIQSIGAGTDQFSREALKQHGVRPASARGSQPASIALSRSPLIVRALSPITDTRRVASSDLMHLVAAILATRWPRRSSAPLRPRGDVPGRRAADAADADDRPVGVHRICGRRWDPTSRSLESGIWFCCLLTRFSESSFSAA
jgi:hypothetical protein